MPIGNCRIPAALNSVQFLANRILSTVALALMLCYSVPSVVRLSVCRLYGMYCG